MDDTCIFLELLANDWKSLLAFGSFLWVIYSYFDNKSKELNQKEFDNYHTLLKELVEPPQNGVSYVDRQCAIIYEFKNFKRYYPFSHRTLVGLRKKWIEENTVFPRHLEELDLTISFLEKK